MTEFRTVSVVVCTYNRKEWLERCLAGVQALVPAPMEVIVVDGPSTDGTRELLDDLSGKGSVIVVPQPSLDGISAARNLGLQAAKGDVVCFLDDDTIPEKGWLAGILSAYDDEKVGGAGGPVQYMSGELAMGKNAVSIYGDWSDESKGQSTVGLYPVMVGCNMSFRTSVLREVGGFDPYFRYHQDETDACLRVFLSGHDIRYMETASVRHEWCEGSYRKDRLKWYLKLRFMWGRNNAHLVRKNFPGKVSLGGYLAHQASMAVGKRVATGPQSKGKESGVAIPRPLIWMGAAFEVYGAILGWR
ncbi:MAG: glycosyltransferase [Methanomassiliicoccales archaeon]|nr:glycosyltransferase [Methanomassiliicoccales archaeon]